jgi:hypothetical protein
MQGTQEGRDWLATNVETKLREGCASSVPPMMFALRGLGMIPKPKEKDDESDDDDEKDGFIHADLTE